MIRRGVAAAALAAAALACAPRAKPASATTTQQPKTHRIRISEFKFDPAELTVMLGDTLLWVNEDFLPHTTTADAGAWQSEEMDKGGMFLMRTPAPGRFEYHCDAHPTMRGVVIVMRR